MRSVLLAAAGSIAAVIVPASPAVAQHSTGIGVPNGHSFGEPSSFHGDFGRGHHDGDRHDRRDRRRFGDSVVVSDWYGGEWARYNNRAWESDSYNDWWHDQPWRSFPRWVQHNENCTPDRMWWSGSGWHC